MVREKEAKLATATEQLQKRSVEVATYQADAEHRGALQGQLDVAGAELRGKQEELERVRGALAKARADVHGLEQEVGHARH